MATFGENLRRERELRGITLAELANATKIRLRHLAALETDQFDRLPGGVFNRGFVRAVARYMTLDEHHWVGEFVRAAGEEPEVLARYAPPNSATLPGHRGLWSFALLVVIFGVGAYLVHDARLRRATPVSPPVLAAPSAGQPAPAPPSAGAAGEAPAKLEPDAAVARGSSGVRPASAGAAESAPRPEELRLQVDALEEAWVSVTADGRPTYNGMMKPGESRSFRGAQQFEVATGNASAVILTLNGETLPPLGNPGERKNLTLSARDLKPSAP